MIFLRKEWTQMDRSRHMATALIVSLALCLVSSLAAARQAPASSQQRLAESQRLENDPQVSEHLSADRLTQLLDPTTATGSSALFVRQVVARYKEQLHEC